MGWLQATIPMGIVVVALGTVPILQYQLTMAFFGKPRKVGKDQFTRNLHARDNRLWEADIADQEAAKHAKA
ncbi:hypothetical protein FVE85_2153 [Porphyridium purpureum]|uniref:Uncharacterized protein n=1 Tax=Porphyridium purpureum TaxID=35688 RepID=A0A5J4YXZ7_PORPP|nr:hypothetical protein FVE85_2153 [Porphyridium purpureum]|eukprot:POR0416..scf209_3